MLNQIRSLALEYETPTKAIDHNFNALSKYRNHRRNITLNLGK